MGGRISDSPGPLPATSNLAPLASVAGRGPKDPVGAGPPPRELPGQRRVVVRRRVPDPVDPVGVPDLLRREREIPIPEDEVDVVSGPPEGPGLLVPAGGPPPPA